MAQPRSKNSLACLQVFIGASTLIVMVDTVDTFRVSRDVEFTQAEASLDNKLIHPKLFRGVIHYETTLYQPPISRVGRTKWANLTGGHHTKR